MYRELKSAILEKRAYRKAAYFQRASAAYIHLDHSYFSWAGVKSLEPENIALTASFALSVLIIYVLVYVIAWLLDLNSAKQINTDLKSFQSRIMEESGFEK